MVAEIKESLPLDESFWQKLSFFGPVRDILSRVRKFEIKGIALELESFIGDRWEACGQEIISSLSETNDQMLLIIDEFPIFVERISREKGGRETVERLLHWFRGLRQSMARSRHPVRFMLGGSIGLDALLGRLGLSATVNDMEVMKLSGFSRKTAIEFLNELSKGENLPLDDDTVDRILERLGVFIPFQLQLVFSQLKDRFVLQQQTLSPVLVDDIYNELLTPTYKKYFSHWDERLDKVLEPQFAALARDLLALAGRTPAGAPEDILLAAARARMPEATRKEILSIRDLLLHDGYLLGTEDERPRLYFASALLRDWWRRWYGDGDLDEGGQE
jgi:hypothetical protein